MKKETMNALMYLTQYDYLGESDENIIADIDDWVKKEAIDEDMLYDFVSKFPNVYDSINQLVYRYLLSLDNEQVENLNDLYDAIIDDDIDEVDEFFDNEFSDYMVDNSIHTPDFWYEIADDELKQNGMEARCFYWCNDIDYDAAYQKLNAYENGFENYTISEVIEEFLPEVLNNYLDSLVN